MRVLLISPVRGFDPPCGDITYTEVLQQRPPEGVEYETYPEALKRGALVEHACRARAWREPVLTLANKAINVLRAKRALFWEPFRFFSVRPGEYDLVHLHVFNARLIGQNCPLVVSSGAPQRDVYRDRRHYGRTRVGLLERTDRAMGRALGVNCNSSYMPQAGRVMVYTDYYRDYLVKNGFVPADRVSVVPILSLAPSVEVSPRRPKRVGFVAMDFERKGGSVLLAAYERVRRARPDAELWIVGSKPQLSAEELERLNITWMDTVPRERLLNEVMPSFDVFAYPTPHDCFSYVTLEAMSCGVAIATSDYVSMPEAVDYGRAGMISPVGDPQKLADNVLALLEPETNLRFRLAAKKRFEEYFSWAAVAPRIRAGYDAAMASYGQRNRGCRPSEVMPGVRGAA